MLEARKSIHRYRMEIILSIAFMLMLLVLPIDIVAQVSVYSSGARLPTSLRRTHDAYGKGPFCTSCHDMIYPLPPEDLASYADKVVKATKMEPGLKRLTYDPGIDIGAVYDPNGGKIVWATNRLGNWTIWSMNDDGSGKEQLTSESLISGWPSWSLNGQEIAYWSWNPESITCDVWKMKADGSSKTQLTVDGSFKGPPAWSPKGGRIAYPSNLTGNMEIYIMNDDGSENRQLTSGHSPDFWVESRVTWHPDGMRLYYQVTTFPLPPGIYTFIPGDVAFVEIHMIDVDTGHDVNLTPNLHENVRSVSHDGSKLACISLRSHNYGLWIMDADGSNQTRLTWDGMGDRAPEFAPDGYNIVYWSVKYAQPDIFMINVDGSKETRLTNSPYRDVYPSWSPDGSKIVFESDRTGNFDIWLLSLDNLIKVDVKFENHLTQESIGKAILTTRSVEDMDGELMLEKVALRFDWDNEENYAENLSQVPYILSSQDDTCQIEIGFSVPESISLGYHFYDVKVHYSELSSGVASKTRIYEHSAGDLEIVTPKQIRYFRLYNELRSELDKLHANANFDDYPEYLITANEEFNSAESLGLKHDFDAALQHFERIKDILNEQTPLAKEVQTPSYIMFLLTLLPVAFAILIISLILHNKNNEGKQHKKRSRWQTSFYW